MQNKLTAKHPLLDEKGHLIEAGWANEMMLEYNPQMVKRGGMSLKEWEYFLVLHPSYALGISLVAAGPGRQCNLQFMDFDAKHFVCEGEGFLSEDDNGALPHDIFQSLRCQGAQAAAECRREGNKYYVTAQMDGFDGGKGLAAEFVIDIPESDLMVLAVPYSDPELFYYNCKANCLPVQGHMTYNGRQYAFTRENSVSTYDWGRGIWEPVNQWYWGSASGKLNGKPFGFNIGHGFGDASKATENMIFYDGVCHKLDEIEFQIPGDVIGDLKLVLPEENYMRPWKFVTSDGRLDMDFVPLLDRTSNLASGEYFAGQHQVFGHFSGTAVLDNGTRLPFENLLGFAEKVGNVWG